MVTLVLGTVHFLRGREGGGLVKLGGGGGHAKKRLKRGTIPKKTEGRGVTRNILVHVELT